MLSHITKNNNPGMVDVSEKNATFREATAEARMLLPPEVLAALEGDEIQSKKGPVFQTAMIAGTMAAKRTADLIPLCHPLAITACKMEISLNGDEALILSICRTHHSTGVEMEALTAVSVAALTVYDMCKALSQKIVINGIRLLEKSK